MIFILYTTHYRAGSDEFARIAETMHREISERYSGEIISKGIFSKKDLLNSFHKIASQNKTIDEFHFIGHSGMYGPMYGTIEYPEQMSPFEWKNLKIPFSNHAKAFFHCCRSARWFAPFFARTFEVETFGYHWYTSFSSDKNTFVKIKSSDKNTYAVGCMGRKSHGIRGSIKKYFTKLPLEKMISFQPEKNLVDASYDRVARMYADVFTDIKVREDEWNWLMKHFPKDKKPIVLDIGCGNGALLKELSPVISQGLGLDASKEIVEIAKDTHREIHNLKFEKINGPKLPVEDQSVDLVISLLSFRYLDWDALMDEIKRILRPGGKVLIIDMITVPVRWFEFPDLLISKFKHYWQRKKYKSFYENLTKLVNDPAWKEMLKYNPIRAEHEMKWYLESRFPGKKVEKINMGWNSSILAFDSGDIENIKDIYLTYP